MDGRYELQRRVGRGGMATVFLGIDLQSGSSVAVKLLHDQYAEDSRFVVLFRQVALAAQRISHPSVARVLDYGRHGGSYYLVEEYVDGTSLARLLAARRALQPAEALSIAAAIASGLAAIHAAGVVHQDVRPSNVLITADGDVKLTDCGIARAAAQTGMTMTTIALNSAYYAPPEQIQGQPLTPASDVYALGIVLFEMLAGRRPFEGANPLHVAMQHINEDAPDVAGFRARLADPTRRAIARMLQKPPSQRFADGAKALRAITGLPEFVPGLAPRTGHGVVTPSQTRRARGKLSSVLLGLIVLAVLAGTGFILMGAAASYVREHPPALPAPFLPTPTDEPATAAIQVPSTFGLRLSAATDRVTGAGLSVGSITYRDSSAAERGLVVEQSPDPGRVLMPGQPVSLVLGTGPVRQPSTQVPRSGASTPSVSSPTPTPSHVPTPSPSATPAGRRSASPAATTPSGAVSPAPASPTPSNGDTSTATPTTAAQNGLDHSTPVAGGQQGH